MSVMCQKITYNNELTREIALDHSIFCSHVSAMDPQKSPRATQGSEAETKHVCKTVSPFEYGWLLWNYFHILMSVSFRPPFVSHCHFLHSLDNWELKPILTQRCFHQLQFDLWQFLSCSSPQKDRFAMFMNRAYIIPKYAILTTKLIHLQDV